MSVFHEKKKGFTIIELMVGALALTLLTMTVGAALIGAWDSWKRGHNAVQMQQDVSLAFRAMAREIRRTPIEDITVGTALGTASDMFTRSGNDLVYRNNILIDDMVTSFSSRKNIASGAVQVSLSLSTADDNSTVTATFYSRN